MNLAVSDAAPKAAPTLVCIEEMIATKTTLYPENKECGFGFLLTGLHGA